MNRSEILMMLDDAMAMFMSGKKKMDQYFKTLNAICKHASTQSLPAIIYANKQLDRIIVLSGGQRIKNVISKYIINKMNQFVNELDNSFDLSS